MADLANELLDSLEELLIENCALTSVLRALTQTLPAEASERVRRHLEESTSDPNLREETRRILAQYREQGLDGTLVELVRKRMGKVN
jgi:hypothetical protein